MSSIHNLPENLRFVNVYAYAEALCAQALPFTLFYYLRHCGGRWQQTGS